MKQGIIEEAKINEIRTSVDIVDVISNYIPLIPRGKNFFGVCPFHADHSPSMSVSKEKQIYTCFSCGASGNVFNFLMDYEHINFIEAVKICATKAGIPLALAKSDYAVGKHQELYDIFELTQKFYINNINTNFGKEAKEYLNNRKIDNQLIREFGVGLALPKKDVLTTLLINQKYSPKTIEKTGLIINKEQGYIDTYINRIMFPLYDLTGKIVGYSGRIYNGTSHSKYFNTKETEIFKKGELLYNYHRAKEYVRKENKLIVVEGFMDVIRMYSIGVYHVVATMGTAVTKQQALLMSRLSKEIVLCFDGDEAGNEATNACINELTKIDVIPKIVRLDNQLDPDDYILKLGKEKFLQAINQPINSMEYKMRYLKKEKDLSNNFEMAKYVDAVLQELSKIDNETYIELSLKKLSSESNLEIGYLRNKIKKQEPINYQPIKKVTEKKNRYSLVEQQLVYYMLNEKEVVKQYIQEQPFIETEKYRKLARDISLFYKEVGTVQLADLLTHFKDTEHESTMKELMVLKIKSVSSKEMIKEFMRTLRERQVKESIKTLQEKIKNEVLLEKKTEYLNEIIKIKQMEAEND